MSEVSDNPIVPRPVYAQLAYGNRNFPQMYGAHIIHAGKAAMDLVMSGAWSADAFRRSHLSDVQVEKFNYAALYAHKVTGIDVTHRPDTMDDIGIRGGDVTPSALRSIYKRTRRGIYRTIVNHARMTIGVPDDAPYDDAEEARFMYDLLMRDPSRDNERQALHELWTRADEALRSDICVAAGDGLVAALTNVTDLPNTRSERRIHIARSLRAARTVVASKLEQDLAQLEPGLTEALGAMRAEDAVTTFPLYALYEGNEEYTDTELRHMAEHAEAVMMIF